ncbi:MAG: hypothetical protein KAQ63_00020 [Candidatus Moranbacteria bacterium]|nr:hypothetical protein [Candidatus Moranbacteria bacterium]
MKKTKTILSSTLLLLTPLIAVHANWTTGMTAAGTFQLPNASVYDIVDNFLLWILMLFTILSVLAFVVAGVMFLMAGTSTDNTERAKNMIKYSIIGIVVGLSGYIIISLIDGILLGNIY